MLEKNSQLLVNANFAFRNKNYEYAKNLYEFIINDEKTLLPTLKAAKFNNSLLQKKTKQSYMNLENFGEVFLGPIVSFFYSEVLRNLNYKYKKEKIWFLAREGYLLKKAFDTLFLSQGIKNIETRYLLVSRGFLFKLGLFDYKLRSKTLENGYSGTIYSFLKDRYCFTEVEIQESLKKSEYLRKIIKNKITLPNDSAKILRIFNDINSYLKEMSLLKLKRYKEYLKEVNFFGDSNVHVLDLGYAGTIQKFLTSLTGVSTIGHYLITTKKAQNDDKMIFNGYLASNQEFGEGNRLLDRSLFLEALLTSPVGQLKNINEKNLEKTEFEFGIDSVAQKNFWKLEIVMNGAIKYAKKVLDSNQVFNKQDLSEYYSTFTKYHNLFPDEIRSELELDDDISGNGLINPIKFFGGQ